MIDWLISTTPIFKAIHISGLAIWCGGLLILPFMLGRHDPAVVEADYRLIRRATHLTYTTCVTPAAVITVIAGTWLIFLRAAFSPWLFVKLALVALLVAVHVWVGRTLVKVAEQPGRHTPPGPYLPMAVILSLVIAILVLVFVKPALNWIVFPEWLLEPRDAQLTFEVPSR
ncbi:CopD family protein [Henriciella sp.]|uniref:CopD family protein n=1 Tax=Henriciella sp. TaxID=1968823 RepID=UPI002635F508|nr:CopD family protein [Henriciella sp.]